MKKQIFFTLGIIVLTFILVSWGGTGHYKINSTVSLSFNQEMNQFNSWVETLADHASEADYRKDEDPNERPKHYIDIDNYSEFNLNGTIPQTLSGAISVHGSSFVYDNGILPWATITAYDSLESCFERLDWDKAVLFASDLGHYVADGHMPLHITRNFDGDYTSNDGIHSRYESTLINSYISQINYTGENINEISNVNQYVFDYLYSNYQFVASVLQSDDYAKSINSNTSSTEYKSALWNSSKDFTILLFKNASHALTELIYTAWLQAGSPVMNPTGIDNPIIVPTVELQQNFPNPFSNSTKVQFSLNKNSKVILQVKDIQGNTVLEIVDDVKSEGNYSFDINTENLSSGIYYLTLDTDKEHFVKQMILVR